MYGFPYKSVLASLLCAALIFFAAWAVENLPAREPSFPAEWDGNPASLGLLLQEENGGLRVLAVWEDSPAQLAGTEPGDRLTALNGTVFASEAELETLLAACTPLTGVVFTALRGGEALLLPFIPPP